MTSEHPGKLSEGFKAAMGSPPEPALQILFRPGFALIVPQSSEQLLEQVCPDDLEAALQEPRKRNLLVLGKVPRVFQPEVFGPFEGFTARLGQCLDLHLSDRVNSLHEMANDMEFIKHDHGLSAALMDDIDVVLPHVTADSLNGGYAFFSPPCKEPSKRVFVSMGTTPDQSFSLQIIDIRMVSVAFLSADLIDTDKPDSAVVFPFSPIVNGSLYGASDRVPGYMVKSGYLIPWQQTRPEGEHRNQGKTEGSFPHAPGNMFHLHPMLRTADPSGSVEERNGDTPQRHVAPSPLLEDILAMTPSFTDTTGQRSSLFDVQGNSQFVAEIFNRHNAMILDSECETYNTFYEHESPPLSGIWRNTLTNGFGSCFQHLQPFIGHRFL